MATEIPPDAPVPRLCHLRKWPDFNGFGFNLHAEKNRTGQYIGKVDDDSPAEAAGMRQGDRIIEVNGVNIANENHKQVVGRIRSGVEHDGQVHLDEVELLVLDDEADKWYKDRNIVVRSDLPHVRRYTTPERTATAAQSTEHKDSPPSTPEPVPAMAKKVLTETRENHETKHTPEKEKLREKTPEKTREKVQIREDKMPPQTTNHSAQHSPPPTHHPAPIHAPAPVHTPEPAPAPSVQFQPSTGRAPNDLKLPMSAAEYKAMLASKKKPDIRNQQQMNFSKKHEIFQSM